MDSLFHFWWLIFPLGGVIGGGVRAISAANERRAERRLERYRIKQQTKVAMAEAAVRNRDNAHENKRCVAARLTKLLAPHDHTDARWLDYEMDIAKLLDFPLMTDMREPLTMAFHRARRRADLLRPTGPDDLLGDRGAQLEYRDAVSRLRQRIRRRRVRGDAPAPQRLLGRGPGAPRPSAELLRLATDSGATPQERQNAYAGPAPSWTASSRCPQRRLPGIERRIARRIEA